MLRSFYPKGERGLEALSGTADDRFRTMFFAEPEGSPIRVSEELAQQLETLARRESGGLT